MIKSARLAAFDALYKVFYENAYSNIVIENTAKPFNSARDKAFVYALVYGVIERKLTLDYLIKKYASSKPKPKILTILRLGAYQILFMDKVPNSAAINESVNLTKQIKQSFYASFVNAVLHKIAANSDIPDDLSVKYSVPNELINMWIKQYGDSKTKDILDAVNVKPPIYAVVNRIKTDAKSLVECLKSEGIDAVLYGDLVKITSYPDIENSAAYKNGLFYIEDISSYECAAALGALPGETVLDMCCAPGGKTFTIAQSMNNQGVIYAFDIYKKRLEQVQNSAERLNIGIVKTYINDAVKFNSDIPVADRILCDVPCSGFGIIRRKPEIRYKSLDSVKALPNTQLEILTVSSRYLKSGGTMIYSTCTLNKKENENVVGAFLAKNKNFSLADEKTTFPSRDGGDGFYRAVIRKNEN